MIYSIIYSPIALETYDEMTEQIHNTWGDKYVEGFKQRTIYIVLLG